MARKSVKAKLKAKLKPKAARTPKPKPKPAAAPRPAAKLKPKPKPAPVPRKLKPVKFEAKALNSIKQGLITERSELREQLRELEEAFEPGQVEASGEVGYDDDYADAGAATFEREKEMSIAANVQDLLDKIEKALSKIADGTYGRCESCGEPISAERLKALPHALLCIRCKTAEERR